MIARLLTGRNLYDREMKWPILHVNLVADIIAKALKIY